MSSNFKVQVVFPEGDKPVGIDWPEGVPLPNVEDDFIIPENLSSGEAYVVGDVSWTYKRLVMQEPEVTVTLWLEPEVCPDCVDGTCTVGRFEF